MLRQKLFNLPEHFPRVWHPNASRQNSLGSRYAFDSACLVPNLGHLQVSQAVGHPPWSRALFWSLFSRSFCLLCPRRFFSHVPHADPSLPRRPRPSVASPPPSTSFLSIPLRCSEADACASFHHVRFDGRFRLPTELNTDFNVFDTIRETTLRRLGPLARFGKRRPHGPFGPRDHRDRELTEGWGVQDRGLPVPGWNRGGRGGEKAPQNERTRRDRRLGDRTAEV